MSSEETKFLSFVLVSSFQEQSMNLFVLCTDSWQHKTSHRTLRQPILGLTESFCRATSKIQDSRAMLRMDVAFLVAPCSSGFQLELSYLDRL